MAGEGGTGGLLTLLVCSSCSFLGDRTLSFPHPQPQTRGPCCGGRVGRRSLTCAGAFGSLWDLGWSTSPSFVEPGLSPGWGWGWGGGWAGVMAESQSLCQSLGCSVVLCNRGNCATAGRGQH